MDIDAIIFEIMDCLHVGSNLSNNLSGHYFTCNVLNTGKEHGLWIRIILQTICTDIALLINFYYSFKIFLQF